MWPESAEEVKPLRSGLTTGSCATACCVAGAMGLFANKQPDSVTISLPKGKTVDLPIIDYQPLGACGYRTATIKDAGDDPDVTHGATVYVELALTDQHSDIEFKAGSGVGTVTREGLSLGVGEPAINPVPRQMMTEHLQRLAARYDYAGGFIVTVGVERGEQLALKTMNPRLGILGGLSILGTTGIVRPFSCAAYIASIHQGMDVARVNGFTHIAATTGNRSEEAIREHYQLNEMALIEMGDFVGAVLKHIRRYPTDKLSICGGFGKITKLANGHLDLNSRASSIDFDQLAALAKSQGADAQLQQTILSSNTSVEALKHCQAAKVDLASAVCEQALQKAKTIVPEQVELEIFVIDRQGQFVGQASSAV